MLAFVAGLGAWWALPAAPERPSGAGEGPVRRIVSLSPALTEILFAIGAGERVVAVTDFTTWPPEAVALPSVGGLVNPNLERLVELAPDLVVMQGRNEAMRAFLDEQQIAYVAYDLDRLEHTFAAMSGLARRLDTGRAGRQAVANLRAELAAVRERVAGGRPVPVFACLSRQEGRLAGLMTCGRATFLDDVLTFAGGANVFGDSAVLYPEPSLEALTARAPEVILELRPMLELSAAKRAAIVADWAVLPTLPAVREGRVEVLTGDHLLLPGPRVGRLARELAELLHPAAFEQTGAVRG